MAFPKPAFPLTRQLTGMADALGGALFQTNSPSLTPIGDGFLGTGTGVNLYEARVAGVTDPGVVGKQNQDDFFVWESMDKQTVIMGVFDGHGREMGQVAAKVAKVSLRDSLTQPHAIEALRLDPGPVFEAAFAKAHRDVEESFRRFYVEQGWLVGRTKDGYLVRTKGGQLPADVTILGGNVTAGGPQAPVLCVHGGTTATVVVLLDGRRMLVSNVGDSTALLCGVSQSGAQPRSITQWTPLPPSSAARSLSGSSSLPTTPRGHGTSPLMLGHSAGSDTACDTGAAARARSSTRLLTAVQLPMEASSLSLSPSLVSMGGPDSPACNPSTVGRHSVEGEVTAFAASAPRSSTTSCSVPSPLKVAAVVTAPPSEIAGGFVELSSDHSPESPDEYGRMCTFRPHASAPGRPELLFVYDALTSSKLTCPAIFESDPRTGQVRRSERGSYYKNVRCEWATLVATPPHAAYQDALAFTRSIGDLHLQTYGVTHIPETFWVDLVGPSAGRAQATGSQSAESPGGPTGALAPLLSRFPLALVLASDGIWDNWKYEEVASFVLSPQMLQETVRTGSAQPAANALMATNIQRGHANFGNSADNMTAIVMYLFPLA